MKKNFTVQSLGPDPITAELIFQPPTPGDTDQFQLIDSKPVQVSYGAGKGHVFKVRFTAKKLGKSSVQIRIRGHVAGQPADQFYDNPVLIARGVPAKKVASKKVAPK